MRRFIYISSYVNYIKVYSSFTLIKEDIVKRVSLFA
jgi:hypothetical protein